MQIYLVKAYAPLPGAVNPDPHAGRMVLPKNLAQGKPTNQSSTYTDVYSMTHFEDAVSGRAVDGFTSQNYTDGSCTRTKAEKNPWWRVDLQETYSIDKVSTHI